MKPLWNIALLLGALAGIVGLSVLRGVREKDLLLEQFTESTRQQVHASASALGARLDELDHDVRLLLHVLEQSGRDARPDRDTERRIFTAAFQALVVVIAQYRSIALYDADGALEVLVTHPTESRDTIEALLPHNDRVARAIRKSGAPSLSLASPGVRLDQRSFLLYAVPVRGDRTIVVTSDTAMFLGAVLWSPPTGTRLIVSDPSGEAWVGCGTPVGCSASASTKMRQYLSTRRSSITRIGAAEAGTLGFGASPALLVLERVVRPTGTWTVSWLASTEALLARELSLQVRLMATAIAAALAVAGVALMMMRQQRKAIALEGSLKYAEGLAGARKTSESIVENAPLGVLGVTQDGRVVLANRFFTERVGPVRIGAPLAEALSGAGGEAGELVGLLGPLLTRQRAESTPLAAWTRSRRFHIRVVPVQNPDLGVSHFALVEDRSELRDLEHQLVRAEKLITVGVLSAGIAHEVGSPLAVIRGRAQQVLRHLDEGPRAEDVRMIIKHIDNISSTIRQLLDFSRRQPIAHRAVPLPAVLERARGLLDWKLATKSLTMTSSVPHDLPPLAADPDQLEQVLVNLLLNACDASPAHATISVLARAAGDKRARIEVVDRGEGIAPEHMNAVFDPFFTTKKRGEGTGLGLSIVASIVRNHSGEIDLQSEPGVGTTVTVLWPTSAVVAGHDAEEARRHA